MNTAAADSVTGKGTKITMSCYVVKPLNELHKTVA